MTAEPGGDGLVAHEFGVLVTRPRQRHHEEPGLEDFACVHIGDGRTSAEVDLHRLARLELQAQRHLGYVVDDLLMQEAVHGRIAAGIAVITHQRGMDW
jgi:hypothetical protein